MYRKLLSIMTIALLCVSMLTVSCQKNAAKPAQDGSEKTDLEAKTEPAVTELPPPTEKEIGHALGLMMGMSLKEFKLKADYNEVVKGLKDAENKKDNDLAAAQQVLQRASEASFKKEAAENLVKETEFLAENGKKSGITTTESGLQYEVLTQGSGAMPAATDKVKVHYKGTLLDGTVFDSSYDRDMPIEFQLNGVIKGWTEGLQLMKIGSKYKFYIPSKLGYGERGAGQVIPGNATLIFEVELLDILPPDPAPAPEGAAADRS